jgi:hypothetical protein
MREAGDRYIVVAVNIESGAERIIAEDKTKENAEAIVMMAVARLGVETEFFRVCPVCAR